MKLRRLIARALALVFAASISSAKRLIALFDDEGLFASKSAFAASSFSENELDFLDDDDDVFLASLYSKPGRLVDGGTS